LALTTKMPKGGDQVVDVGGWAGDAQVVVDRPAMDHQRIKELGDVTLLRSSGRGQSLTSR